MGWIHSQLWGIVCGKAAPEQGQKQPRLLKVHACKLTDTVSSARDAWQWRSHLPGLVGAHTNLRLCHCPCQGHHCAGKGGGGAGAATVGPGAALGPGVAAVGPGAAPGPGASPTVGAGVPQGV